MPRFTANIAFLFPELPFLERIDAAAHSGFRRVECHFPYDIPVETIRGRCTAAGVAMTGLNTAPGGPGEFGLAGLPGRQADFHAAFTQALDYAKGLGCSVIHVMAGVVAGLDRAQAERTYVANLRWAAGEARGSGITLVLEPLNHRDRPDYLVTGSDQIARLIGEIGEPGVKILFDVYHVQIMEGDLIRRIERHRDLIGHVQLAAVPSRAEPDEGEVALGAILETLDAVGYAGLVGLEYRPRGRTEAGLEWLAPYGGPGA